MTKEKPQEVPEGGRTQTDKRSVSLGLSYSLESAEEQRTRIKKRLFLETLAVTQGVITLTCEKANVGRSTYYEWLDRDPVFAEAVKNVEGDKNEIAADILWGKVTVEKDGPSVRFFLERRHPGFKTQSKIEHVITGDRTLEDLLDEDEAKLNNEQPQNTEDESGATGEAPTHSK